MATTTLVIDNEQLSANLFDQVEELIQTKDHPYKVVDDAMSGMEKVDSPGERTIVRFETDDHSQAQRVVTGHENVKTTSRPILTPGHSAWAIAVQPVFISRVDEKRNSGKVAILNILKGRVDNVFRHLRRQLQQVFMRGAGATGTWPGVPGFEDLLSLNGGDSTTGLIEDQADGTNTLHNVAKASFPLATHERLHNYFKDAAGDASANLLNHLYSITVAQQIKEGDINASELTWYISQNGAEFMKQALQGFEQYTTSGEMDHGARRPTRYMGVTMRPTAELPNSGAATTGNPWTAVLVNWARGVVLRMVTEWALDWDKFENLSGTVGTRYALCKFWGQLCGKEVGLNGLIVDGEVF